MLPEYWDIYGWKLKRFSLRLQIQLSAIDSPFMNGQAPNAFETFEFLKVCSNESKDVFKLKKASIMERIFYTRMCYNQKFHAKVFLKICQYLKENTFTPNIKIKSKFKDESGDGNTVIEYDTGEDLPDQLVIAALFTSKYNMTLDEVWDMPISLIGWYSAALAAVDGASVKVVPNEVSDTIKENAESLQKELYEWELKKAEELRLAMVNGVIPKKKIKLSFEK